MKFSELKSRFKNKYVMRVIAGVLCIAVLGGGYGTQQKYRRVRPWKNPPNPLRKQRKKPRTVMWMTASETSSRT